MWILKNLLAYTVVTVVAWLGLTLAYVGTSGPLRTLAGGMAFLVLIAVLSFGIPSSIAIAILAPARRRIDGARFFCLAAPIMVLAAVPMLRAEPGFHEPLVVTVQIWCSDPGHCGDDGPAPVVRQVEQRLHG